MFIFGILAAVFAMLGFGVFNVSEAVYAIIFKLLTGIFFGIFLILIAVKIFRNA